MKYINIILISFLLTSLYAENVNVGALKGPTGLSMVELIYSKNNITDSDKVEYSIVNTPDLIVSGLLSGNLDIAALPTNLAAIIYNKKPDYCLAAVTGDGTLYILSSRDDIKTWSDLKNKKVNNIARSSTPGFLFNNLLEKNEIDINTDINIDYTYNHIELAPLLITGKIETGILPEPLVTNVLLKNREMKVVLDFQKEYARINNSSYPLSCVVVKKSLVENNPNFVKEFLTQLKHSIEWVKENPMKAGEKGESIGLGVTGPLIVNSIERLNLGYKNATDAKPELEAYYQILADSDPKSVGGKLPESNFYLEFSN